LINYNLTQLIDVNIDGISLIKKSMTDLKLKY